MTGRVSAAPGLEVGHIWLYSLFAPRDGFVHLTFDTSPKNHDGDFEFRGVPQGSYELRGVANPGEFMVNVPVRVDRDVEGVLLSITSGTRVTGHITIEGADKAALAGASIHFSDGYNLSIDFDGTFNASLYPDRYNVYLNLAQENLVIKSMRSEGVDVFQDGLTVSADGKASLEIVLAPEGAQVDGIVSDPDGKPVAGATVVLIAEPKLRSRSDSYHEGTTDQYGRYHFENIRPGDYKLFAWDDVEPNAWFDPEFLQTYEPKGERIVLQPQAHQVSNLHVIPAAK